MSMCTIMMPKVIAKETILPNFFFRFQGNFSGPVNGGVFNITSGSVTIESSTYSIANSSSAYSSNSEINQFITMPSGQIYLENIIALAGSIEGQFGSYNSNYTMNGCSIYSIYYYSQSVTLSIIFSSLSFMNSSSRQVLCNATAYASLQTSGTTFLLSGSSLAPSNPSQSTPDYGQINPTIASIGTGIAKLIDSTLTVANGVLSIFVNSGNGTSGSTLTPTGTLLVTNIANLIDGTLSFANAVLSYYVTPVNATSTQTVSSTTTSHGNSTTTNHGNCNLTQNSTTTTISNTSGGTLTPAGVTLVNNIAGDINSILQAFSSAISSISRST